jgi:hypothetical protein
MLRDIGSNTMNSSAILATVAMNSPRYWKLRDDACSDVETSVKAVHWRLYKENGEA